MPFGLRNDAQTFQQFTDHILHRLYFTYTYIDDVWIASASPEAHLQHLREVFHQLSQYHIAINSKCVTVTSSGQLTNFFHLIAK